MNTFLPFADFQESLQVLDKKRLFKQAVEAKQLLNGSWPNHPVSKMWRGYESALVEYYNTALRLSVERGVNTKMQPLQAACVVYPPWLGYPKLHASHRANLVRKAHESNSSWNRELLDNLRSRGIIDVGQHGYLWPIQNGQLLPEIESWLGAV